MGASLRAFAAEHGAVSAATTARAPGRRGPRGVTLAWVVAAALASSISAGAPGARGAGAPGARGAGARAAPGAPARARPKAAPPSPAPAFRLPDGARPVRYTVELTVVPSRARFQGEVTIELELREPTSLLWLNGRDLTVEAASLEQAGRRRPATVLPAAGGFLAFSVASPLAAGPAVLRARYTGALVDGRDGTSETTVGLFRQRVGADWYAFTQLEPLDARRVLPCFDEPRHKTPWRLAVVAPADQLAAANAPLVSTRPAGRGLVRHEFAETPPLPSYLLALVVGPFEAFDGGQAGRAPTPIRILTPRGQAGRAATAARAVPPILDALEGYFDLPYPYAKLDLVSVPDFFGAMENPGLVTFAERTLLDPAEGAGPEFEHELASVAAHELAHMWFGDLVTMAWWDDLWLNESFATWLAARTLRSLRAADGTILDDLERRERAMAADLDPGARPLRRPVRGPDDIFEGGGILYAKGAEVLGMFERWIGDDRFRAGIRRYVAAHAGGSATTADFLAAVSAEAGQDVAAMVAAFVERPGAPLVTVRLACARGRPPALEIAQERLRPFRPPGPPGPATPATQATPAAPATAATPATPAPPAATAGDAPWPIPFCARWGRGHRTGRACVVLATERATVPLEGAAGCPDWVLANEDATGYYRVHHEGDLVERLLRGPGAAAASSRELAALAGDLDALVRVGAVPAGDALALLPRLAGAGAGAALADRTIALVERVERELLPEDLRPRLARLARDLWGAQAIALGWTPTPGEEVGRRARRRRLLGVATRLGEEPRLVAEARRLAVEWLDRPSILPTELAALALEVAAAHGDAALHARLVEALDRAPAGDRRQAIARALGSFRDPALLRRSVELARAGRVARGDLYHLLEPALADRRARSVVYRQALEVDLGPRGRARAGRRAVFLALRVIWGTLHDLCDRADLDEARRYWARQAGGRDLGSGTLRSATPEIERCIAFREAQGPSAARFLQTIEP